jgi:hypothetical protein
MNTFPVKITIKVKSFSKKELKQTINQIQAGIAMLGIPLVLWILTIGCIIAWFFSAIASIVVIGIPFFILFTGLIVVLLPLAMSSWFVFYTSDIIICVKAK